MLEQQGIFDMHHSCLCLSVWCMWCMARHRQTSQWIIPWAFAAELCVCWTTRPLQFICISVARLCLQTHICMLECTINVYHTLTRWYTSVPQCWDLCNIIKRILHELDKQTKALMRIFWTNFTSVQSKSPVEYDVISCSRVCPHWRAAVTIDMDAYFETQLRESSESRKTTQFSVGVANYLCHSRQASSSLISKSTIRKFIELLANKRSWRTIIPE